MLWYVSYIIGRTECKHTCLDKMACNHLCCKHGRLDKRKPGSRPKRRKITEFSHTAKKVETSTVDDDEFAIFDDLPDFDARDLIEVPKLAPEPDKKPAIQIANTTPSNVYATPVTEIGRLPKINRLKVKPKHIDTPATEIQTVPMPTTEDMEK